MVKKSKIYKIDWEILTRTEAELHQEFALDASTPLILKTTVLLQTLPEVCSISTLTIFTRLKYITQRKKKSLQNAFCILTIIRTLARLREIKT